MLEVGALKSRSKMRLLALGVVPLSLFMWSPPLSAQARTAAAAAAVNWPAYLNGPEHSSDNPDATAFTPTNSSQPVAAWKFTTTPGGEGFGSSPTVYDGYVYIGDENGYFYKLNLTSGKLVWSKYLGTADLCDSAMGITATATVSEDPISHNLVAYVASLTPGSTDGGIAVDALSAATGAVLWRTTISSQAGAYPWASPTVVDGHIYVGISSVCDQPLVRGGLAELDQHTGAVIANYWAVAAGGEGASIWSSAAADSTGSNVWVSTGNGPEPSDSYSIVRLNGSTLAKEDIFTIPDLSPQDLDFGGSPTLWTAVIDGSATSMVGACNKNGTFYALEAQDLAAGAVWTYQVGIPGQDQGCLAAGVWDASRQQLFVSGAATTINGTAFAGSIQELNPATGVPVWQLGLPGQVDGTPSLDGSGVLAVATFSPTDNGIFLVSEETGAELGELAEGTASTFAQPVFADGYLLVANYYTQILAAYVPSHSDTLTTALSSGAVITGGAVTDTATLIGATSSASGTISVSYYWGSSSSACSGTAVASETAGPTTDGDGSYSATFSSLAAGDYEFQASYAGDANNTASESVCGTEPLTVASSSGGWSLASYSATEADPASSLTISVPSGTTAGDTLVVVAALRTGATEKVSGITDSATNTWAPVASAYVSGSTNRSEYWEALDAAAIPTGGTVTINFSSSLVSAAYLLAISGGESVAPFAKSTAASSAGISGDASSGDIVPSTASDLQVGWVQTPNKITSEGTPNPEFTAGTGTQLGWLESSSGLADYLSLDLSYDAPATRTSQAYSTTFSGTPSWSTGIATLEAS